MKLLFENWRRYLKEDSMNELTLPFSSQAKMDKEMKKLEKEMVREEHASAWDKIKQEIKETKEASGLAMKYFSEGLTEEEKNALWEQIKDVARGTTLAAIFAVPFGSVLLPFVLKYTKDVFLPSAFRQKIDTELTEIIKKSVQLPIRAMYLREGNTILVQLLEEYDSETMDELNEWWKKSNYSEKLQQKGYNVRLASKNDITNESDTSLTKDLL